MGRFIGLLFIVVIFGIIYIISLKKKESDKDKEKEFEKRIKDLEDRNIKS
jgi:hypothetical protein